MVGDRESQYNVLLLRFGIATVILVVNTALFGLGRVPVYFLVAATYLLTIGYSVVLLGGIQQAAVRYLQVIFDLVIATLFVHYTGGIDSVLSLLYPLASVGAGILIAPRAAVAAALLGSALFTGLVSLEFFGVVAVPDLLRSQAGSESSYVFSLLYFKVTVFCIIGFLGAYLLEQVRKKDDVVLSLQERLRREDRLTAIGRLAASTAHEIRNPLASISGCVEALKESLALDAQSERLFNLIIKETGRLNNIINGLLEFGKPRKVNLQKIAPAELMDEVITLIRSGREFPPQVNLSNEALDSRIEVPCDEEQMKQVFFNLLSNALEAVGEGGRIAIRERLRLPEQMYEIAVSDNGMGMDADRLASLFQPFSSGKEHGVGLGLAIAYSIMQEHGGTIEVESQLGKGAQFRVLLPMPDNESKDGIQV